MFLMFVVSGVYVIGAHACQYYNGCGHKVPAHMSVGLLVRGSECMHAGCDVVRFPMMISDNNIGSEGATALAPSLGRLAKLAGLNHDGG